MTSPLLLKVKRLQLGFRNLDLKDCLLVGPHLYPMTLLSQLFVDGPRTACASAPGWSCQSIWLVLPVDLHNVTLDELIAALPRKKVAEKRHSHALSILYSTVSLGLPSVGAHTPISSGLNQSADAPDGND